MLITFDPCSLDHCININSMYSYFIAQLNKLKVHLFKSYYFSLYLPYTSHCWLLGSLLNYPHIRHHAPIVHVYTRY